MAVVSSTLVKSHIIINFHTTMYLYVLISSNFSHFDNKIVKFYLMVPLIMRIDYVHLVYVTICTYIKCSNNIFIQIHLLHNTYVDKIIIIFFLYINIHEYISTIFLKYYFPGGFHNSKCFVFNARHCLNKII